MHSDVSSETLTSKVMVSRNDNIYELAPDVVRLPGGKLICIYRESDGHRIRQSSNIVIRTSVNDGHAWSKRHFLVEARLNEKGVILNRNLSLTVKMVRLRYMYMEDPLSVAWSFEIQYGSVHTLAATLNA